MPAPPSPAAPASVPSGTAAQVSVARGLLLALALPWLVGPALPVAWGLAAPAAALALVALVAWGARRGLAAAAGGLAAQVALAGVAVVLIAQGVRALVGVATEIPASWSGVAAAALVAWLARRLAVRPVVALPLVLAALMAGALGGARFEASAPDARGWAQSSAILGIHPFQITAVRVDGYGPIDLPINDYVEPQANRGYGPEELAEVYQLALRRAAELHAADGPARLRKALLAARVEALRTPGVRESLGREPEFSSQPRVRLTSGTYGPRSKIEFVCPGATLDPRGFEPQSVRAKMCPDKYAAEASAGLGVTGRWAGYAEGRGNGRVRLARLLGASVGDDAPGRALATRERRVSWLAVLALLAVGLAWPARSGRPGGAALVLAGGAGAALLALGLVAVAATAGLPQVGLAARAAGPAPPDPGPWLATLVPLVALAFAGRSNVEGGRGPSSWAPWAGAVGVALGATWVVAASPVAGAWLVPDPWGSAELEPYAGVVLGLSSALTLAAPWALDVQDVEAVLGAAWCAALLGAVALLLGDGARRLAPHRLGRPAVWALAVAAGALAVGSPRTAGGALLLPAAAGLGALVALAGLRGGLARVLGVTAGLALVAWGSAWALVGPWPPTPVLPAGAALAAGVGAWVAVAGMRRAKRPG